MQKEFMQPGFDSRFTHGSKKCSITLNILTLTFNTRNKMTTLQITLDIPIARNQIRHLRGLVVERAGQQYDLLHNHRDGRKDQVHYRYPLVQYKVVKGQATVMGINEGATLLRSLLDPDKMTFAGDLTVLRYKEACEPMQMTEQPKRYMLRQWLALNEQNYVRWKEMESEPERMAELERILTAHLLAFAAGIGFTVPRPRGLEVVLEEADAPRRVRCHDGQLLSFDVVFRANIALPPDVGIGDRKSVV